MYQFQSAMNRMVVLMVCLAAHGCAHAPRVIPAGEVTGDADALIYYTLPKAMPVAKWSLTKKTFTAGPYTASLESWTRASKPACDGSRYLDSSDACYWRLESRRPNAATALAACALSTFGGNLDAAPKAAYLVADAPPQLSALVQPDFTEQYAVQLSPSAFERLKTQITLTPQGGLMEFTAASTHMAAEVAEAVTSALISGVIKASEATAVGVQSTTPSDPPRSAPLPDLQALIDALHETEVRRLDALELPDASAALAAIALEQAALKALAEGAVSERTVVVEASAPALNLQVNSDEDPKVKGDEFVFPTAKTEMDLTAQMACAYRDGDRASTQPSAKLVLWIAPVLDSYQSARRAARSTSDDGLRYRVAVDATGQVVVACSRGMRGRCSQASEPLVEDRSGPFAAMPRGARVNVTGNVSVPQWGTTLSLPRRVGWGSGSISAKIDPQLGSLTYVATENTDSLGASVVNNLYAETTKDKKTAALMAEQQALDLQVKICASRAALGLPLGQECPEAEASD